MSVQNEVRGTVTVQEAHIALKDILNKYTNIKINNIDLFAPVFYPIAIIEMDMLEKSFEDFDMIQQMVLRCVALEVFDPQVIAGTLGLSESYVKNVLTMMEGLGQISGSAITNIGRESLNKGQSISLNRVKQKFQIDAVNGNLLKLEQEVFGGFLVDKERTSMNVGHMVHIDAVDRSEIIKNLQGESRDYLKEKRGILNTNVEKINSIRFVEMKYAKSYMMKLKNHSETIVFVKRLNDNPNAKESGSALFSWLPYSINSKNLRNFLGVDELVPTGKQQTVDSINKMVDMIYDRLNHLTDDVMNERVEETVKSILNYAPSKGSILINKESRRTEVYLNDECLSHVGKGLLDVFFALALDDGYITTCDKLSGHIIYIEPVGECVNEIIAKIRMLKKQGVDTVKLTKFIKTRVSRAKNLYENQQQAYEGIINELNVFE